VQATIFFALRLVVVSLVCLHASCAQGAVRPPADTVEIVTPSADTRLADYALDGGVQRIRAQNHILASLAYEPARFDPYPRERTHDFAIWYVEGHPGLEDEAHSLASSFPLGQGIQVCGCWGLNPSSIVLEPQCTSGAVRLDVVPELCAPRHPRHVSVSVSARPVDPSRFLSFLRSRALPLHGASTCARHVRQALEAAGFDSTGHPARAKDWGPTLFRMGFASINPFAYQAARGDVVVFEPELGHPNGHIQAFDGKSWISDFVQSKGFWPSSAYRDHAGRFTPYRYARDQETVMVPGGIDRHELQLPRSSGFAITNPR
jgi:hypothetical protein